MQASFNAALNKCNVCVRFNLCVMWIWPKVNSMYKCILFFKSEFGSPLAAQPPPIYSSHRSFLMHERASYSTHPTCLRFLIKTCGKRPAFRMRAATRQYVKGEKKSGSSMPATSQPNQHLHVLNSVLDVCTERISHQNVCVCVIFRCEQNWCVCARARARAFWRLRRPLQSSSPFKAHYSCWN